MALYKKDDMVNFKRNEACKANGISIVGVVPIPVQLNGLPIPGALQCYVIEHEGGWIPNPTRMRQFGLDRNKKYLFVQERELTAIGV